MGVHPGDPDHPISAKPQCLTTQAKYKTHATLETLYHISRELATALDLRTVLQRVLFLAMKNVGAMSGSIIVLDDAGQPVESAIIHGAQLHDQTTQQLRVTIERGLAGWVINNRQAAVVNDTSRDERWVRRPDDAEERTGPKSAVSARRCWRANRLSALSRWSIPRSAFSPWTTWSWCRRSPTRPGSPS